MEQKIILLADDDRDDREMFCEALFTIDTEIVCNSLINGQLLLEELDKLAENPGLIFLDLNMPVINGLECLRLLKADARYRDIPVVIISTSSHILEIETSLKLGALCYFVKPNSFDELISLLKVLTANIQHDINKALQTLKDTGNMHIFFSQTQYHEL